MYAKLLRKFIYDPVILASLDQGDLGKFAGEVRSSGRYQDDGESVVAGMSAAGGDLEGANLCFCVREEIFHLVGVLRAAEAVAEENHAVFEVSGLPGVQEMVGGGQGEYVTGVGGDLLLMRSSPEWGRQKDCQKG